MRTHLFFIIFIFSARGSASSGCCLAPGTDSLKKGLKTNSKLLEDSLEDTDACSGPRGPVRNKQMGEKYPALRPEGKLKALLRTCAGRKMNKLQLKPLGKI